MRLANCSLISAGLFLLALPAMASPKHGPVKLHAHANVSHTLLRHSKKSAHGVMRHEAAAVTMPSERATQIQTALIKQGYLSGEPTGAWDSQTVTAMQKLQSDNGWQSRITPDSRALIKLGLGPEQAQNHAPSSPQ
jgi:hypothetical protein